MSSRHLVMRSSGHPFIRSSGHHVIMSSGHPVIMSSYHLDVWSFGQPVIWSSGHLVIWSSDHPVIKSSCHFQHCYKRMNNIRTSMSASQTKRKESVTNVLFKSILWQAVGWFLSNSGLLFADKLRFILYIVYLFPRADL